MNEDRIAGTAKNLGGKVEEGVGRMTGDAGTQVRGAARQVEGDMQNLYGQAKDTAAETFETVREAAYDAGDVVRDFVEQRPYTTAFAALCIGWAIGRMGRSNY
ncbi:MAG: CsbD family protein [Xanthobacteraceae bacterium]